MQESSGFRYKPGEDARKNTAKSCPVLRRCRYRSSYSRQLNCPNSANRIYGSSLWPIFGLCFSTYSQLTTSLSLSSPGVVIILAFRLQSRISSCDQVMNVKVPSSVSLSLLYFYRFVPFPSRHPIPLWEH